MILVKNVYVTATDKLYYNNSRVSLGLSVQTGIVFTDCGDNNVPVCVLGQAFLFNLILLNFFAVVEEQTLHDIAGLKQLSCVAVNSTGQLYANLAKYLVTRHID